MKILISVDIEGIAGVFHSEQTRPGNGEFENARIQMTMEANAAVRGAFNGGATQVLVNDSHGTFRNLLPALLDPRAQLIAGKPRKLGMMSGLECHPSHVFMVGYHAKSQSHGILAHTINSFAFEKIHINNEEYGEAGLYAALAADYGAQVVFASGDDVFVEETQKIIPNARFVITKTALGVNAGISFSPQLVCDLIEKISAQALTENQNPAALQKSEASLDCRVQTSSVVLADLFSVLPNVERLGTTLIGFTGPHMEWVIRMLNSLSVMSSSLR